MPINLSVEYPKLQKEIFELRYQNADLINYLKVISDWAGNLPDESFTTKTGANDAAYRGNMVVAMRSFAKEALQKYNNT